MTMSECWNQWLRAPAVPRPASRSPSSGASRDPRNAGRKSEGQCGGNGYAGGERQHAPVEREPHCAHGLRHKRFQESHRGHGECESGDEAESSEHQAFGEELCGQSPAPSPKRRAQAEDSRCSRTRWPELIPRAASTRTAVWRNGGAARRARLRLLSAAVPAGSPVPRRCLPCLPTIGERAKPESPALGQG